MNAITAGQSCPEGFRTVPGQGALPDLSPSPPLYSGDRSGTGVRNGPEWIRSKIENNRRVAKETTCRCGSPVLVGLDADRAALTATVDPEPIDAVAELYAVLHGRHTYDLHGRELHARDDFHIRANPAGTGRWPVLREHSCDSEVTQRDQLF